MALFNVSVLATLNIPREVRDILRGLEEQTVRVAAALDAIVAKMNEPEPDDPQPAVDALVAKLAESNTTLADEVAKILAVNP